MRLPSTGSSTTAPVSRFAASRGGSGKDDSLGALPLEKKSRRPSSLRLVVTRFPRAVFVLLSITALSLFLFKAIPQQGWNTTITTTQSSAASGFCKFRPYPRHRYYELHDRSKDFLKTADYIYGEWPIVLPTQTPPHKFCLDQSSWQSSQPQANVFPFADGTNPSILSLERVLQRRPIAETKVWIDQVRQSQPTAVYLATACMTNSQCVWGDPVPATFSNATMPDAVLTTLLVLDGSFHTLFQATIALKRDAPWGKRMPASEIDPYFTPALDDARLFVHDGRVWVSYREGKGFGWDTQVLNPIHVSVQFTGGITTALTAELRASETTSFCCGRNMALMEHPGHPDQLESLTWVDPVTVVTVDTTPLGGHRQPNKHRKLQSGNKPPKKKSHVHGTNAFMVYLAQTNEFLGMAHFHRPPDRNPNPYARFGHHYTHALFAVSGTPPHRLTALSPEFVLPQAAGGGGNAAGLDAEIIQFASGLEWLEQEDAVVIAYGINDCEAAAVKVDMKQVRKLLRPVPSGQQVVDVMRPLLTR